MLFSKLQNDFVFSVEKVAKFKKALYLCTIKPIKTNKAMKTAEDTQIVTVDTIIAEFRGLLNSRFLALKRRAEIIRGISAGPIVDPKFYAKLVREYIGSRKLTAKYNERYNRQSLVEAAIKHAEHACHAPGRREAAAMYSENFRRCGL